MRRLTKKIQWDSKNKTLYRLLRSSDKDLPRIIELHRKALELTPDDAGIRYALANCLYVSGQIEQAQAEWETVRQSGDQEWTQIVTETLNSLPKAPS